MVIFLQCPDFFTAPYSSTVPATSIFVLVQLPQISYVIAEKNRHGGGVGWGGRESWLGSCVFSFFKRNLLKDKNAVEYMFFSNHTFFYISFFFFFSYFLPPSKQSDFNSKLKIVVVLLYALFAYEIHVHVQPGATLKHAKEGTESSAFWSALGGKQSYTSKKVVNEFVRDPHLFTISFNKGSSSYHVTSYYRILLCNCLLFY